MCCFCLPIIPFVIRKLPPHVFLVGLLITLPFLPLGHIVETHPITVPPLPVPRDWSEGPKQGQSEYLSGV